MKEFGPYYTIDCLRCWRLRIEDAVHHRACPYCRDGRILKESERNIWSGAVRNEIKDSIVVVCDEEEVLS